jgi:hypothetical protein
LGFALGLVFAHGAFEQAGVFNNEPYEDINGDNAENDNQGEFSGYISSTGRFQSLFSPSFCFTFHGGTFFKILQFAVSAGKL